jgi:UDP-3-O-[3-hydroxymyristoyl] glucosamine N-acyltransferase
MNNASPEFTLGYISERLKLICRGDANITITGIATLASASVGQLSFLANPRYLNDLRNTSASAVIVASNMAEFCPANCLLSPNPYLSYAQASSLFATANSPRPGIHATAVVDSSARISSSAQVGANAVIGAGVRIGDETIVGAGCVIGDNSLVGNNCLLYANVSVYHGVKIGDRVILHSGSVIGSDGFGFAPAGKERSATGKNWIKIHQLGGVVVGDDVEIGANSAIDNLVQIAHNVVIGNNTAIAGCTAIAGSSKIGSHCTIAGRVSILGHLTIADGTHITNNAVINKSIADGGSYSSGSIMQKTEVWRKNAVRFSQLNDMYRRLVQLEKKQK